MSDFKHIHQLITKMNIERRMHLCLLNFLSKTVFESSPLYRHRKFLKNETENDVNRFPSNCLNQIR